MGWLMTHAIAKRIADNTTGISGREKPRMWKTQQIIELIQLLATSSGGFTSVELAERLGCDRRTAQRYLAELRQSTIDLLIIPCANGTQFPTLRYRIRGMR